ncbi:MAG: Obg family GTPase, partial [Limisphaerales bacterium]
NGEHGLGKGMDGKAGKDLVVKVPCGTLVWHLPESPTEPSPTDLDPESALDSDAELAEPPSVLPTGFKARPMIRHSGGDRAVEIDLGAELPAETETASGPHGRLVADLTSHGQQFVLCQGGRGGLGNRNFATARRQTPRFAQPGEPGGEGRYLLELRLMAEVGLVGYPNAGKSTLLTAISKARPRIAPYPFTTLHPQIGIVEYEDWHRLTVCDVPGLVEGAHLNVGLGHAFLRHIQRCPILVLLIDMAGSDGRKPWDDHRQLLQELERYDPTMLERKRVVVANKMDEAAAVANLKSFKRRVPRTPILPISAAFGEGVEEFKLLIRATLEANAA